MLSKKMVLLAILSLVVQLAVLPAPQTASANARIWPDNQQLETRVSNYLSGQNGTFGVAALNLDNGQGLFVNSNALFPAASMYKVLVMYRVFQTIDQRQLSLTDTMTIRESDFAEDEGTVWYPGEQVTVSRALWGMIAQSSNVATYALMRQIGGEDSVSLAAQELGMTSSTLDSDGFWTTPADMAHFFYLLATGQLVSPSASQVMIDLLKQQQQNDRIPALLPEGVQVAHKTGEADGVVNDGGIVFGPGGSFVLVIMSEGGALEDESDTEAMVAQMIYRQYAR